MRKPGWLTVAILFAMVCAIGSGCTRAEPGPNPTPGAATADMTGPDAAPIDMGLTDASAADTGPDATTDASPDLPDTAAPLPELATKAPASTPADTLAATGIESCEVYLAEACDGGVLRRCEVYDTSALGFVDPDPLLRRVLLYDRWYDLHHQPLGQTAERTYKGSMPAGTPESEWASDDSFARYEGLGDSAIWNGSALVSAAMRYLQTGTEADYARMERKTRDLLLQFDVTQIPGYLARYHYLLVGPEAPQRQDVVLHHDSSTFDHTMRAIEDPASVPDLPQIYLDGTGTPMFQGNPSIDQYTGPRTAFPLVHGLLRDEELKARIERHLVCYLNRMERIEVRNLQQNADAIEAIAAYFGGGTESLNLDPGDPDLTATDTVVLYVTRQLNSMNEAEFDRSCPAGPQLEPTVVIDATSSTFTLELLQLGATFNSKESELTSGIDHFYVPSVRGADALHLMHLAALAYHFTGEEQYREFLFRELMGNIGAVGVAKTAASFVPSRFCRQYYGHHIGFTPAWGFLTLLEDQPLRANVEEVFRTEFWQKEMFDQWNAKFEILYVGEVEDDATARAEAIAALHDLGGNGGVFDDPRRSYTIDPNVLAANLPAGNALACPTVAEIEQCERPIVFGNVTIPVPKVTMPCTGALPECPIGDECMHAQARDPLPPSLRRYEDFLWQRNPYYLGHEPPREGWRQSPGLDLTEEFWLARHYGLVDEGAGQALGWRDVGTCP